MRRFISIAVAGMALVLAAPASTATSTVQIKTHGVRAGHRDDQPERLGHLDEHRHEGSPGRGERRLVRVADPEAQARPTRHVSAVEGRSATTTASIPTLKGTVIVRGAPPVVTLAVSVPVVKFGTQVTLTRRRVQQEGRRDGHDRRQLPVRADHEAGRRDAADDERRRVHLQRDAAAQHDVPGPVEGRRKLGQRAGAADDQAAVRLASRATSTSTSRPASRSRDASSTCSASRSRSTWINVAPRCSSGQQSGRIMGMKFVRSMIPRGRWSIRIYMPATEMPRRLHRRVERHAAGRQALTYGGERGLLVRALVPSSERRPS